MPGRFHMAYRKVQKNKVCAFGRYSNLPGSAASKMLIALEGEDRAERLWDLWLENWSFFRQNRKLFPVKKKKSKQTNKQTNNQSKSKTRQKNKEVLIQITYCHI